jgi:hypothetical protein
MYLWGSFVGLLEAASLPVRVIRSAVGGSKCACGGHLTADSLRVALS